MRLIIYSSASNLPEAQRPTSALRFDRVLVVDDVALNREILIMLLGDAVRHSDEAADGLSALALFKQCHYDAVLLDIEMPGLDGYDTMGEMRRWEREHRLPPIPVVAITNSDLPGDEQRILAAGATAYLAKPIKQHELMTALKLHCTVAQNSNPMANLLPRFFASAHDMLDEMAGQKDREALLKNLHKLGGMIAVFGFEEFTKQLKRMHWEAQQGEMPSPAEFDLLREELQQLETVARAQS